MKSQLLFCKITGLFALLFFCSPQLMAQGGPLDPAFDTDGLIITDFTTDITGKSVAIQADGKIVVAGATSLWGIGDILVVRYNSDGSIDNSFDGDGFLSTPIAGGNSVAFGILVQSDAKILVAGNFNNGFDQDFVLVRYLSDGTLDNSFDGDGILVTDFGGMFNDGHSFALQVDGKIIVTGISSNAIGNNFTMVRYNSDGSLDNSFDGDGVVILDPSPYLFNTRISILPDAKLLVSGTADPDSGFRLLKFNSDGSVDTGFDFDGMVTTMLAFGNDNSYSHTVQSDGKIVVAGVSIPGFTFDVVVIRYNSDGSLDNTFDSDGVFTTDIAGSNQYVTTVKIQVDGKIVVTGTTEIPGTTNFALVRLLGDGTPDPSFDADGIVTTTFGVFNEMAWINGMAIQTDDKIVVVGDIFYSCCVDSTVCTHSEFTEHNSIAMARYLVTPFSGLVGGIYATPYPVDIAGFSDELATEMPIVFPNPCTSGILQTSIPLDNATLTFFGLSGEEVAVMKKISGTTVSLERSGLPEGVYFLRIQTDEIDRTEKIILHY